MRNVFNVNVNVFFFFFYQFWLFIGFFFFLSWQRLASIGSVQQDKDFPQRSSESVSWKKEKWHKFWIQSSGKKQTNIMTTHIMISEHFRTFLNISSDFYDGLHKAHVTWIRDTRVWLAPGTLLYSTPVMSRLLHWQLLQGRWCLMLCVSVYAFTF